MNFNHAENFKPPMWLLTPWYLELDFMVSCDFDSSTYSDNPNL